MKGSSVYFIGILAVFSLAEFKIIPDIAVIDFPPELFKLLRMQVVISTFLVFFYLSYLFYEAGKEKDLRLMETNRYLHEMYNELNNSREEVKSRHETLKQLNTGLENTLQNIAAKNKALDVADKTKDKLFTIIGHDLKNPLTSLVDLSAKMHEHMLKHNPDQIEVLAEDINTSANKLKTLVMDLLNWSRTQTGSLKAEKSSFTLMDVLAESHDSLEQNLLEKQIFLSINCSSDITVFADKNMTSTIVDNLLKNAIKFTETNGSITLNAMESKGEILLKISDTGVGMNEAQIEQLFDINKNKSTFGTNNEKGSGLGLPVCAEFLKLNNGTIKAESKPGKGSVFTISFPVS